MKNAFLKGLAEGLNKNLPAILTGVSVLTEVGTVGYSVWSGWKIKEITEDEELDNKTKVKKIVLLSIPTVAGTIISGGCSVAAHKESSKRYAALAVTAGAGAISMANEETKDKVLELVDKDHKVHKAKRSGTKANITAANDEVIEILDEVTGYKFNTTLADLWFSVNAFNDEVIAVASDGNMTKLSAFYEHLLGDKYSYVPAHDLIKFGSKNGDNFIMNDIVILSVQLDSKLDDNLKPIYSISYDYIG